MLTITQFSASPSGQDGLYVSNNKVEKVKTILGTDWTVIDYSTDEFRRLMPKGNRDYSILIPPKGTLASMQQIMADLQRMGYKSVLTIKGQNQPYFGANTMPRNAKDSGNIPLWVRIGDFIMPKTLKDKWQKATWDARFQNYPFNHSVQGY